MAKIKQTVFKCCEVKFCGFSPAKKENIYPNNGNRRYLNKL